MRHKRPLLAFENTAIWFKCFQGVPNILGYIHAIAAVFEAQNNTFSNSAVIVIGSHSYLTTQYHKSLILVGMVMDGNFRAGFQRIEPSGREHL